ncbi:MAG: hypothetical protein FWH27_06375 [Planctomycetaceae bacterium]|nr:hypothetical protein [Planctomycetaceae bacterium]
MATKIDPKRIRIDCDTQPRLEMSEAVITEYAEAMERGEEFPAILVFFHEETDEFIIADGFHRYHAHMRVRPNDPILAEQELGSIEDAIWASLAANKSHGLQRTNADKRNAIRRALLHPRGCQLSNRQIAKHVGVNDKTVAAIRCELESGAEIPHLTSRQGLDGKEYPTASTKQSEPQPKAYCVHCINYSNQQTCTFDGSTQVPWTPACDEFEPIPPEPERRIVPPVTNDYKIIEPPDRSKKPKTSGQYKPRNTLAVDIPLDNPQLAAVELRESLGEEYLKQCFISVRVLLTTDHSDDPFPNLR